MTEIKLNPPLCFNRAGITSVQVNKEIGRTIIDTPVWTEKFPTGEITADTEPTVFTYTSKQLAYAFYTALKDRIYDHTLENEISFQTKTLTEMCNEVLAAIDLYGSELNRDYVDSLSDLKQDFFTALIFGTQGSSYDIFKFLSWNSRRHISAITLSYERSEEVPSIVAGMFERLIINSSDNSHFCTYSSKTIQSYEVAGITVYSKIPEAIAKSFSYFLRVDNTSSYLDTNKSIFGLPKSSGKILMGGPTGDIVFEDSYSEEYCLAMNSSQKIEADYIKSPYRSSLSLEKSVVRKRTLKRLCSIIPVIDKVITIDPATLQPTEVNFLRIRINAPVYKFLKYKSSKAFLHSLPSRFFSYEGLSWIDPTLYSEKMRQLLGKISKYNPDFISKIMDSNIDINSINIPSNDLPAKAISSNAFRYHEVSLLSSESEDLQKLAAVETSYNSLSDKVNRWTNDRQRVRTAAENSNTVCSTHRGNIEYYTAKIEEAKKSLVDELAKNLSRAKEIDKLTANIDAVTDSLSELAQQVEASKNKKIQLALSHADSLNVTWLDNVKKSNIEFNSSYYTIPAIWLTQNIKSLVVHSLNSGNFNQSEYDYDNCYISIEDCPQLAFYAQEKLPVPLELIFGKNAQQVRDMNLSDKMFIPSLGVVNFSTIKPSIIRVDGSETKRVVGGPYHVQLRAGITFLERNDNPFRISPKLIIKLKDESSTFGYLLTDTRYNVWIHPHTSSFSYPLDNYFYDHLLSSLGTGCLGDASPAIYKAFEDANVRTLVFTAKVWIESANSADTWGRNYKHFPKVKDVIFDEESAGEQPAEVEESQEISEVEVNEMLQDLMDQAAGQEPATQVTEPEIIIETITPVEETPEIEVTERINEIVREAIADQPEPVVIESASHDSPPSPAYTTYAELASR